MNTARINRRALLAGGAAAAGALALGGQARAAAGSAWSQRKRYATVDGIRMAYYEEGEGTPIVFLHGNPTSSYLWRKVIPFVRDLGRCIAPDMVGMGDSQKLPDSGPGVYTFVNHRKYLFGLLEQLGVTDNAVFVIHDWGSAMGFHWAEQNPDKVRGIAYMEALLRPTDREGDPEPSPFFQLLRSPRGEKAILEDNLFLKGFFREVGLYLSVEDRAEYERPFLEPGESRRPMLTWPRQIPNNGEPAETDAVIRRYSKWLTESAVPKLLLLAEPGLIFGVEDLRKFARSLPNQKVVRVYGSHFIQEVSGEAIGRALRDWIPSLS